MEAQVRSGHAIKGYQSWGDADAMLLLLEVNGDATTEGT
jgi:hypothetical protein